MANSIDASNAYVNTLKNMAGGASPSAKTEAGGASFGDILKAGAQSAIEAQHRSERTSAAALVGKADMTDVLQAVNEAELALNTVLALRDRVVQAYQEIMRTPI